MQEGIPLHLEPKPTLVYEIQYPGFTDVIREITSKPRDVEQINSINNAMSGEEYDDVGPETIERTTSLLLHGTTLHFDSMRIGSPHRAAIGTEAGEMSHTFFGEAVIATQPLDKAGEIKGYTYIYPLSYLDIFSSRVQQRFANTTNTEISYATPVVDALRDPNEITESLMQSSLFLYERLLGRTTERLTGEFSSEEIAIADSKLTIFTTVRVDNTEKNYRKGVVEAGFKKIGTSKDFIIVEEKIDGEIRKVKKPKNYITYALTLSDLLTQRERRASNKFTK